MKHQTKKISYIKIFFIFLWTAFLMDCSTNPVWGLVDESFYTGQKSSEEIQKEKELWLLQTALGLAIARPASTTSARSYKYIFLTATTYSGSLFGGGPGVSQIDAKCNSDANRPDTNVNYKAMIYVATRRIACTSANCTGSGSAEHTDWVLAANQEYRRSDGTTTIATTTSNGIFDLSFGLANPFHTSSANYWSGLDIDWTGTSFRCASGADWNDGTTFASGTEGDAAATDSSAISLDTTGCNTLLGLLCVEQ